MIEVQKNVNVTALGRLFGVKLDDIAAGMICIVVILRISVDGSDERCDRLIVEDAAETKRDRRLVAIEDGVQVENEGRFAPWAEGSGNKVRIVIFVLERDHERLGAANGRHGRRRTGRQITGSINGLILPKEGT